MNEPDHVTEKSKEQMELYGITMEQKTVFQYRNYRYDHLTDALNYARIDSDRRSAPDEPSD